MAGANDLIHPATIFLPNLPAELEGLRIAHLSDLHVSRWSPRYRKMVDQLTAHRCDLVVLTGDYMAAPGRGREMAVNVLADLTQRVRPSLGFVAVLGHCDDAALCELTVDSPIRWLHNESVVLSVRGRPRIELLGLRGDHQHQPDAVATLLRAASTDRATSSSQANDLSGRAGRSVAALRNQPVLSVAPDHAAQTESGAVTQNAVVCEEAPLGAPDDSQLSVNEAAPLRCLLAHSPMMLSTASDLGVTVMFCGQKRRGDLPSKLSAGVLRHRNTICLMTRGLCVSHLPFRLLRPPQLPLYRLRRGPMPGVRTDRIELLQRW